MFKKNSQYKCISITEAKAVVKSKRAAFVDIRDELSFSKSHIKNAIHLTKNKLESFLENEKKDELYNDAIKLIQSEGRASTSFLQRKLQIGYNRAARIVDTMEADGIVGKPNHVGKREIL